MSKTHDTDNTDLDSALDAFLAQKKVQPVVSSSGDGVDIFGSTAEKKKSFLQRIMGLFRLNQHRTQLR